MKTFFFSTVLLISQVFFINFAKAQIVYNGEDALFIGKQMKFFEDLTGQITFQEIQNQEFHQVINDVPNYGLSKSIFWFKFEVKNETMRNRLFLEIKNSSITNVTLYSLSNGSLKEVGSSGEAVAFSQKYLESKNPIFPIAIPKDSTQHFLLKVSSINTLLLPIVLQNSNAVTLSLVFDQYVFGIYLGIILVIFFYNFFVYLSIRDKNYLYYVLYILCVGFTQACLKGYAQKFLWPEHTADFLHVTNYIIASSGIFSIIFVINFLQVKVHSLILLRTLYLVIGLYVVSIIFNFFAQYILAQQALQVSTILAALMAMITGIFIWKKGFKSALFFNISWFFFISGVTVYVLKDAGILPLNTFTDNSILFGSSIEVTLLSFALADKINIYKEEKEASQAEALRISQENEQLIKQQNIILEEKVRERTTDLESTNKKLSKTLSDLQETQLQLVEAEKMASLGQLTAGIAHEINNPINFVKSNIKPLQLDLNDLLEIIDNYDELHNSKENLLNEKLKEISKLKAELDVDFLKTEIQSLIKGIEEGAERTAEIVRSLRTFSRLDEGELKEANVHDGLNSTLILLKNSIPHHVRIIKNYHADANIECYAGKLNQVFMNILNNAVQAILTKKKQEETESITITTRDVGDNIEISIKDSGIGMTEEVKQKIYDPFFTTKDVGEGTGLGMSIVFKIIEKHGGRIKVNSSPGNGAEFIITLPHKQSTVLS